MIFAPPIYCLFTVFRHLFSIVGAFNWNFANLRLKLYDRITRRDVSGKWKRGPEPELEVAGGTEDEELLAALGAWLGWTMLPLIILISAVVGAVTGVLMIALKQHERSVPIPFGPYLAAAGWIAMLWGKQIVNWYLDYMS